MKRWLFELKERDPESNFNRVILAELVLDEANLWENRIKKSIDFIADPDVSGVSTVMLSLDKSIHLVDPETGRDVGVSDTANYLDLGVAKDAVFIDAESVGGYPMNLDRVIPAAEFLEFIQGDDLVRIDESRDDPGVTRVLHEWRDQALSEHDAELLKRESPTASAQPGSAGGAL